MSWTKTFPPVDGFYWYREARNLPVIVEVDTQMGWIYFSYSDCPAGPDLQRKIDGEFWDEILTPPQVSRQRIIP